MRMSPWMALASALLAACSGESAPPTATQLFHVQGDASNSVATECQTNPNWHCWFLTDGLLIPGSESNVHGGVQLRRVYWQNDVWINGVRYDSAVGMHAPSSGMGEVRFVVPWLVTSFRTVFGFARVDGAECTGNARGTIYIGASFAWSRVLTRSSLTTVDSTSVTTVDWGGIPNMTLRVEPIDDNSCDHTTWGDPHFRIANYFLSFWAQPEHTENIHGGLQADRVYWQNNVWVNGVQYFRALGMHAPSSGIGIATYRVPDGFKIFRTKVGFARQDGNSCSGHAGVRVKVNSTVAFSGTLTGSSLSTIVALPDIPIAPSNTVSLEVDPLGDNSCDHTTWLDSHFRR